MTEVEVVVALMPRSLLVFKDDAYSSCLHGIEAVSLCLSCFGR